MAETIIAPPLSRSPAYEEMAKMSREALVELREQIAGEAMDVTARMKPFVEVAIDKLPNSTHEDDSRYALQLLLEQFPIEMATSNRTFAFTEVLLNRIASVSNSIEGGSR